MLKAFDYTQLITHVEDRAGHDIRYAINAEKLSQLGWKPEISLEQGLKATVQDAIAEHAHK